MRVALAHWLRLFADLIDWEGAPKRTTLSFTFEPVRGVVTNENGRGCPLWYYGNRDYERAHSESEGLRSRTTTSIQEWTE